MAFAVKTITIASRIIVLYVERGDPSGIPVVFLHGLADSWRSFDSILSLLPGTIRAIAIMQRGHGDAERSAFGYSTRDFAGDLSAFVEALRLGPIIVVGHSMGSAHAICFAIDYPEQTLGLVLESSIADYRKNTAAMGFYETAIVPLKDPINSDFVRGFQESTHAKPVPHEFTEMVFKESLKISAMVWRASVEKLLEDDSIAELGGISVPTLLVWGDQDGFATSEDQEAILRGIKGSKLIMFEGAGHSLHWEEQERFTSAITEFAGNFRKGAAYANAST
jgi:non-heme chloroperoxidase